MTIPADPVAPPAGAGAGLRFTKGEGTGNDFVLVLDPDGRWEPHPSLVAALCERRTGVGGDGVIRVIRSVALADGAGQAAEAEWFMDYHNSDGSPAEMCGNGIRVFVAYLLRAGLAAPDEKGLLVVGSRKGPTSVRYAPGSFAVELGPWRPTFGAAALRDGADSTVVVDGLDGVPRPALSLDLGNPHTVVALAGAQELAAADLTHPPRVLPDPPNGTNVEVVVPMASAGPQDGHLVMRVHERGVGETRSCGTGACAAALAVRAWGGADAPECYRVDVPGGSLVVRIHGVDGVELSGPARLVFDGVLDPGWAAASTR